MPLEFKVYYGPNTLNELLNSVKNSLHSEDELLNQINIRKAYPSSKEDAELALSVCKNVRAQFKFCQNMSLICNMFLFPCSENSCYIFNNNAVIFVKEESYMEMAISTAIGNIVFENFFNGRNPSAIKEIFNKIEAPDNLKAILSEAFEDETTLMGFMFSLAYANSSLTENANKYIEQFSEFRMPAIAPLNKEFKLSDFLDLYFSVIIDETRDPLTIQIWKHFQEIEDFLSLKMESGVLLSNPQKAACEE